MAAMAAAITMTRNIHLPNLRRTMVKRRMTAIAMIFEGSILDVYDMNIGRLYAYSASLNPKERERVEGENHLRAVTRQSL